MATKEFEKLRKERLEAVDFICLYLKGKSYVNIIDILDAVTRKVKKESKLY